jgi:Helicase associated domain
MQHNNNSSLCPTGGTFPFQPLSCRETEVEVLVRSALRTDAATLLWKQSFQTMNITFEMEHKVTRSASTHLRGDGNSASPMCEKSNCLVSCTDLPHLSGKVRHVSIDAADTHRSSRPTLAKSSNRKRAKEDAWSRRYNQILQYRAEVGHCIVPRTYADVGLYGWIKKQRYNHKQWELGKPSQLTHERIKALDDIGFSWSARSAQWESRFEEFQRYVALGGDARIGTKSSRLFDWAKTQRREHREWLANGESTMTQDRYERLTSLGFRWSQR